MLVYLIVYACVCCSLSVCPAVLPDLWLPLQCLSSRSRPSSVEPWLSVGGGPVPGNRRSWLGDRVTETLWLLSVWGVSLASWVRWRWSHGQCQRQSDEGQKSGQTSTYHRLCKGQRCPLQWTSLDSESFEQRRTTGISQQANRSINRLIDRSVDQSIDR